MSERVRERSITTGEGREDFYLGDREEVADWRSVCVCVSARGVVAAALYSRARASVSLVSVSPASTECASHVGIIAELRKRERVSRPLLSLLYTYRVLSSAVRARRAERPTERSFPRARVQD